MTPPPSEPRFAGSRPVGSVWSICSSAETWTRLPTGAGYATSTPNSPSPRACSLTAPFIGTLGGIPRDYEALAELWDTKGIEFQRLLIEAVLEPITVKPAAVQGRRGFDSARLVLVPRA